MSVAEIAGQPLLQRAGGCAPGQSDAHPPASAEVLQLLLLHGGAEAQAVEDARCSDRCLVCVQLLQTLVELHQLLAFSCAEKKKI